ncbi:DotU family type IV/VI secretion system protein [Paraburkholderia sp. HP33-1]|uniref:DotU family type IV/VI secretion system protein n=1 Tax=Paraburkholderia sp. HP33-1 TaxID=2883243 RepID=UPI001F3C798C|nr:DotU/TssL family secretion system protein [Paraburkholderia sp. HP33-1]
MLDAGDKSEERLPLMHAFVTAFAYAEQARGRYTMPTASETDAHTDVQPAGKPAADPHSTADALATQLQAATRKLARDAMAWTGAAGEADIAAAQYAYVALLDERLLFTDWPGASAWETQPLEARIFGTRAAGERLPDAIETLLAQRDPAQRDLANVYLACLTLGFKGLLRGESGALRHDQLRHALFAFSVQRDPEPDRIGAPLELSALAPRETRPLTQTFPDRMRLGLLLGGGCAVMVGISHLLWLFATAPVRTALDQFEAVSLAGVRSVREGVVTVPRVQASPSHAQSGAPAADNPGSQPGARP